MSDLDIIAQIDEKIHQLPPNITIELNEYIDFLLQKQSKTELHSLSFWQATQLIRATIDFEAIGNVDDVFNSVRDRQTGREIDFS